MEKGIYDQEEVINKYIEKSRELLKVERQEEEDQLKELLSSTPIRKLQEIGLCLGSLKIKAVYQGIGDRPLVVMNHRSFEKSRRLSYENDSQEYLQKVRLMKDNVKFRNGDILGIYEFHKGEDTLKGSPVLSGTVERMQEFKVKILCGDSGEFDVFSNWHEKKIYCLVKMVNEVTFKRYNICLDRMQFYLNRDELHLRELLRVLFGVEKTKNVDVKNTSILKALKFYDQGLNFHQQIAIKTALTAEHFSLIHGPPGTGKTKTVCELVLQLVQKNKKVLVAADSNIAVDNILDRLQHSPHGAHLKMVRIGNVSRVLEGSRILSLDFQLQEAIKQSPEYKSFKKEIKKMEQKLKKSFKEKGKEAHEARRDLRRQIREITKDQKNLKNKLSSLILQDANIILSTHSSCLDTRLEKWIVSDEGLNQIRVEREAKSSSSQKSIKLVKRKFFDVAVLDEAAQSIQPSSMIPILLSKKVVLAGDHKQLPPTVKSKEAQKRGLARTLFDKLSALCDDEYPSLKTLLQTQYRMNSAIMGLSSKYIYDGKLEASETVAGRTLKDFERKGFLTENGEGGDQIEDDDDAPIDMSLVEERGKCLIWVDTSGGSLGEELEDQEEDIPKFLASASSFNKGEVEIVGTVYADLRRHQQLSIDDIGVISPYRAQVEKIKTKLETLENGHLLSKMAQDEEDEEELGEKTQAQILEKRPRCEVSTVDGFQGREKEVIILSLVRANPKKIVGFLQDERRMNVAITRAKRLLVIIGDSRTVTSQNFIYSIYNGFKEHGTIISVYDMLSYVKEEFDDDSFLRKHFKSGAYLNQVSNAPDKEGEKYVKKNEVSGSGFIVGESRAAKKKRKKQEQNKKLDILKEQYKQQEQQKLGSQQQQLQQQSKDQKKGQGNTTTSITKDTRSYTEIFRDEQKEYLQDFIDDEDKERLIFNKRMGDIEKRILQALVDDKDLELQFQKNNRVQISKKRKPKKGKNKQKLQNQETDSKEGESEAEELSEEDIKKQEALEAKRARQREKKKRQRQRKQEKKMEEQEQKQVKEMDEEEQIEYILEQKRKKEGDLEAKQPGFCQFVLWGSKKRCLKNIKLLGITCKYCKVKYCTMHAFPEMHGCHDAVCDDKSRQMRGTAQLGDRAAQYLKGKLRKQLKEKSDKRKPKQKNGNSKKKK